MAGPSKHQFKARGPESHNPDPINRNPISETMEIILHPLPRNSKPARIPSKTTAASDQPVPWSQTTPGIRGGERRVIPRLAIRLRNPRDPVSLHPLHRQCLPVRRTGRCNRISQHPTYLTENYNSPALNFESRKRPTVDIANFLPPQDSPWIVPKGRPSCNDTTRWRSHFRPWDQSPGVSPHFVTHPQTTNHFPESPSFF